MDERSNPSFSANEKPLIFKESLENQRFFCLVECGEMWWVLVWVLSKLLSAEFQGQELFVDFTLTLGADVGVDVLGRAGVGVA